MRQVGRMTTELHTFMCWAGLLVVQSGFLTPWWHSCLVKHAEGRLWSSLSRKKSWKTFFWRSTRVTLRLLQSRNDAMDRILSLLVFSVFPHSLLLQRNYGQACINFGRPKKQGFDIFRPKWFFCGPRHRKRERFVRNKTFREKKWEFWSNDLQ